MNKNYEPTPIGIGIGLAVWIILGCMAWSWMDGKADRAQAEVKAQVAGQTLVGQWWNKNDHKQARIPYMLGACVLFLLCIVPGGLATVVIDSKIADAKEARQQRAEAREQERIESNLRTAEAESVQAARQMNVVQSNREIISRLGAIDGFIRILAIEQDATRRIVILQDAQAVLLSLTTKLASGELAAEAMTDTHAIEHARETHADLVNQGLGNDRLARDIARLFHLTPMTAST